MLRLTENGLYCPAATSTSIPGARSIAPSSRTPTPTTRVRGQALPHRAGRVASAPRTPRRRRRDRGSRLRRNGFGRRRERLAASGRAHPGLGAGADRAARARSGWSRATTSSSPTRPARRSSRCAATPSSPSRTFGLPIYRWRPQAEVFAEINAWWRANQAGGQGEPAVRLRAGQGAAGAGGRGRVASGRSTRTGPSSG